MTDDLVKRLRQSSSSNYSCQGCMDTEREEAADRIEKLEMLLHGEKCLRQDLKDTAEAHSKQQRDRIAKLEAALIAINAMHHDGGVDDVEERDDRTYFMVCSALEELQ